MEKVYRFIKFDAILFAVLVSKTLMKNFKTRYLLSSYRNENSIPDYILFKFNTWRCSIHLKNCSFDQVNNISHCMKYFSSVLNWIECNNFGRHKEHVQMTRYNCESEKTILLFIYNII